jgi:DNA-binding MarR family transcriptional regulator
MTGRSSLIQQVRMALRSMGADLARLNDVVASFVDLKGVEVEILDHIGRIGPVSPGQLAETMHIHPATMTGILDRLEQGGWVTRERAPDDRRKVNLKVLRSRGPELVKLYAPMNESIGRICADLSEEQLIAVVDFLESVSAAAAEAANQLKKQDE